MKNELIFVGTGSAFPSGSYNACFAVRTPEMVWLTDGGGGYGLFAALERCEIRPEEIHYLFVTHSHTDHIFGAVWLLRKIVHLRMQGRYDGRINVYANSETARALTEICRLTFLDSYFRVLGEIMDLHPADPGDRYCLPDASVEFFDAGSENVSQAGMRMNVAGKTIVALGDEALTEANKNEASGADILICGAFCRYADREIFHPYEKHHWTVRDVAQIAAKINVGTLVLIHSEDLTPNKPGAYRAEAAEFFPGSILIPLDATTLPLN